MFGWTLAFTSLAIISGISGYSMLTGIPAMLAKIVCIVIAGPLVFAFIVKATTRKPRMRLVDGYVRVPKRVA